MIIVKTQAAYAYDNKSKPYSAENQGRLLKVFQTKIKTDQWYGFALQILPTETIYELRNESGFSIEALKVDHRDCGSSYKSGSKQGFYFGGQCPAPQAVTACFKEY